MKKIRERRGMAPPVSVKKITIFVMKQIIVLTLFFSLCSFVSSLAQKMNRFKVEKASIEECISIIEKRTGMGFFYDADQLDKEVRVTTELTNVEVKVILDEILKDTDLGYKLIGNNIVISKKEVKPTKKQEVKARKITGNVTDSKGRPLPGVSIVLKGTAYGTATDVDGNFILKFPADLKNNVLAISFIGMKSREINIGAGSEYNIVLEEEEKEIEEVVVTGIINRKSESFTGSAITAKADELENVASGNIFQSLKNIDPSLNIASSMEFGSDPNVMPSIKLRGTSTFPAESSTDFTANFQDDPNMPLFILDGFEANQTAIFDLDRERVESVTILKDAAAKAIYGSKAANGVIVIETKSPASGVLRLTYKGTADITAPDLTSYNLCNAAEKLEVEKIAGVYETTTIKQQIALEQQYNERLQKILEGDDTYWLSKPLRVGLGTKHSITAEMGEQKTKMIANLSYNNVQGVMKGSERVNISGSVNLSYKYKSLLFKNIMSVNSNNGTDSPYGSFDEYAKMNPYWDAYNEDGGVATSDEYDNPLYNATINTSLKSSYFEFTNNFYTEWAVSKYLKTRVRLGVTNKRSDAHRFYPANHTMFNDYSDEDFFRKGAYQLNQGKYSNLSGDFNLNYSKNYGRHYVLANAGFNIGEKVFSEIANFAEGFPSDKMNDITFALQYAESTTPVGTESKIRDIGFLGMLGYYYDDKYLCDLTLRHNGSSQFGANNKWGTFWSVGVGWNMHKEDMLKGYNWIDQLKLRGSIGTTGSQNFSSYQAISTYLYYLDKTYNGQLGAYVKSMANEDLKWQEKFDYNAGFDARIWRFILKFDYYESYTENLITDLSSATSIGYTSYKENIGRVRNSGVDFRVTYKIISSDSGFLNLSFNAATNKNEIRQLSDAMREYNEQQDALASVGDRGEPVLRYVEGGSLTSIWAVPSLGIDPYNGKEIYVKKDGTTTYTWDSEDQVIAGNTEPAFTGNISLSGEFNGIGFNVGASFLTGADMYNYTLVNKVENIDLDYNVDARVLEGRWQKPGDHVAYKTLAPYYNDYGVYITSPKTKATTRFVQKRSDLDISYISLYYDLRKKWLKKYGMERLKVMFNINDLYEFSTIEIERGTTYPFSRTMSFSLRATF